MKTHRPTPQCRNLSLARASTTRATALLGALILVIGLPCTVWAELYDDFEDPERTAQLWTSEVLNGTGDQEIADGVARLWVNSTADHGFSTLFSVRRWTLQAGRTLELRADLIRSNGDGAIGYLAFSLGDGARMYTLGIDQDTVFLGKRANPRQIYLLENGVSSLSALSTNDVKLCLTLTSVGPDLHLRFKVIDNGLSGAVLFEREFRDTPAADPLQIGIDDPPQTYLGLSGLLELSVYHDNAGAFDPGVDLPPRGTAEVVFDNVEVLEYESAWIRGPEMLALLPTWPEDTAEELIPVGAETLDGPWSPCAEPVFSRHGRLGIVLETSQPMQFVKLVPGRQFFDDFNPPKPPFSGKDPWIPAVYNAGDLARWSVTQPENALRAKTLQTPADGRLVLPVPYPALAVADFSASVDILGFESTGSNAGIGIGARVTGGPNDPWPGTRNGYIGSIWPNLGGPHMARLSIWDGTTIRLSPVVFTFNPGTPCRLIFSGVGTRLSVELIDLATLMPMVEPWVITSSAFAQGQIAIWTETGGASSQDVTLDNFFITGTTP
jgi:hypothetical protein